MRQVLPAMSGPRIHDSSSTLRTPPWEDSRLAWALAASLLLHLSVFGIYKGGQHFGIWEKLRVPAWVQRMTDALMPAFAKRPVPPPKPNEDMALMLLEVNPAFATEPPKNAQYYAAHSTVAANPDADQETGVPKISGAQERMMRTEDTQLSRAQPLQPAPQPTPKKAETAERPEEEAKAKPTLQPGSLTLAKPDEQERKTDGQAERPRPRTVAEAKARLAQQQRLSTAGEKARQDGGVRRRNVATTLNAIGTPFGAYDAAIVAAIQERWYGLLEERSYASDKSGKVVLEFRLNYDGRVTDLKVVQNTVDELLCLLCQKAILDPSPFARWPAEMRRLNSSDSREVRFTFFYN
jgi:outer membrane biosynthesis protein TonB